MSPVPNATSGCAGLLQTLLQQTTPCLPNDTVANNNENLEKSDLQALLYIVVTLLFYSCGITIGIIGYLKREQQELEETKQFEQYMSNYIDNESQAKFNKVQQVIARLEFLKEEKKKNMEKIDNDIKETAPEQTPNCVKENIGETLTTTEHVFLESNLCGDDVPLSSIVAKLINPDKHLSDDVCVDDDVGGQEAGNSRGIKKTFSMQSIKDYAEEPGRSARNSLAIDDDDDDDDDNRENVDDESSKLLVDKISIDLEHETFTLDRVANKECIVTNV